MSRSRPSSRRSGAQPQSSRPSQDLSHGTLEPQAVLLSSPNYLDRTSLPLCVPGEPESQPLAFAKETMVWASPANAGAQVLAEEIATTFAGLTISTADARPATVTHMLLYLNEDSFSDARLAEQV